jgi:hypothetical protein
MTDLKTTQLHQMESLINQFQALRMAKQGQRLQQMETFLAEFEQQCHQIRHDQFNVFSLLNVSTDEVRHSAFLAWLLDARAEHGQGTLFLKVLVNSCRLPLTLVNKGRYRVLTEYAGDEAIVDILIYRPEEFLIYLENKIFAPEGSNQIDREFGDMRQAGKALDIPTNRQFAIFLTPDGRKPISGNADHWRTLSYQKLAVDMAKVIPIITSPKLRFLITDWLDTVATFGGMYDRIY